RIVLDFRVNGAIMGSEIAAPADATNTIEAEVAGTAPLQRLELVRDGEVIAVKQDGTGDMSDSFRVEDAGAAGSCFYYLRVFQSDGEMAWSSPVWVDPE
ncbi:MAG: hypothetical protein ACP5KN_03825, partial [Armatimonadota bacterium]